MTELLIIVVGFIISLFLARSNGVKSEQVRVARKRDEVVKKTQANAEAVRRMSDDDLNEFLRRYTK